MYVKTKKTKTKTNQNKTKIPNLRNLKVDRTISKSWKIAMRSL